MTNNSINISNFNKLPDPDWMKAVGAMGNVPNEVSNITELNDFWKASLKPVGLDFLQYSILSDEVAQPKSPINCQLTIGDQGEWMRFYKEACRDKPDPLYALCLKLPCVNWDILFHDPNLTDWQKTFRNRLQSLNLSYGCSFLLEGQDTPPAYFSLGYRAAKQCFGPMEKKVILWSLGLIHKRYVELLDQSSVAPNPLSERERQVAACLVKGMSNTDIAAELGLSKYTVGGYVKSIFLKLKVKNRTDAGLVLLQKKYI